MKLNEPTKTELRTHQRRVDEATRLMLHYFELIARKAGVNWDSDNAAEVRELVTLLIGDIK